MSGRSLQNNCLSGNRNESPDKLERRNKIKPGWSDCNIRARATIRPKEISSYALHHALEVGPPVYIFRFPAVPSALWRSSKDWPALQILQPYNETIASGKAGSPFHE